MSCTPYALLVLFQLLSRLFGGSNSRNRATECNSMYLTSRPGNVEVCNHLFAGTGTEHGETNFVERG